MVNMHAGKVNIVVGIVLNRVFALHSPPTCIRKNVIQVLTPGLFNLSRRKINKFY